MSDPTEPDPAGREPGRSPNGRASDVGGWARVKRTLLRENWYRDLWLLVISGLVLVALIAAGDRQGDLARAQRDIAASQGAIAATQAAVQTSRTAQTGASCRKQNQLAAGVNRLGKVLKTLILASSALPGDKPGPLHVTSPSDWRTLKPGPLSMQLQRTLPGFPDAQQRLEQARANARRVTDVRVRRRDCAAEVRKVRESGKPKRPPAATPTAAP